MWYVKSLEFLRKVCRYSAYAGALALLGCVAMTVVDVTMRNFFSSAILGSVELTQLLVMWSAFLTIPLCFAYANHISVDFFVMGLGEKAQSVLQAVGTVLAALVMAGYAWWAGEQAMLQITAGEKTLTLGIPIGWFWLPLIFGTVLSLVCAVAVFVNMFAGTFVPARPEA